MNLAEWQAIMQAPMRNKRYRLTNAGDAVFDYLTWKEIEDGAAPRTLDQYERDLSRLCLAHPAVPAERLTADQYRSVIAAFPAGSRRRATAVFRDFSRWLYQEGRSDEDAMGRVRYPRTKRQAVIDVSRTANAPASSGSPTATARSSGCFSRPGCARPRPAGSCSATSTSSRAGWASSRAKDARTG
ncbi:MAG: hypothetical protein ACRDNG_14570 [Gaiellaceae bacterium]